MIAVGRRIQCGPDQMRIVIGAGRGQVDEAHAELAHDLEQRLGFGEIVFERIVRIAAERIRIRRAVGFRHAGAERAGHRQRRIRLERHGIERGKPHADLQPRRFGANALDDLAHEARAVLQAAAVRTGPVDRAEEFVAEIAVAMLDVDEIVTAGLGALGRDDIIVDQPLDLVVADHGPVRRIAEFAIEQRMVIGDDRIRIWCCRSACRSGRNA